jgi:hypothetical protein
MRPFQNSFRQLNTIKLIDIEHKNRIQLKISQKVRLIEAAGTSIVHTIPEIFAF